MTAGSQDASNKGVLLVYYSPDACRRLEAAVLDMRLQAYSVDGRAPDAQEQLKRHPARLVVIDHGAQDVSVAQAVRSVGQVLPTSLVITALSTCQPVELYKAGHRIGWEENLAIAISKYVESGGVNFN